MQKSFLGNLGREVPPFRFFFAFKLRDSAGAFRMLAEDLPVRICQAGPHVLSASEGSVWEPQEPCGSHAGILSGWSRFSSTPSPQERKREAMVIPSEIRLSRTSWGRRGPRRWMPAVRSTQRSQPCHVAAAPAPPWQFPLGASSAPRQPLKRRVERLLHSHLHRLWTSKALFRNSESRNCVAAAKPLFGLCFLDL